MTDDPYQPADPDEDDWELAEPDPDDWIIVRHWDRFQHYKDRLPVWIKLYTALLSDPDYLKLSAAARGILHGIWLAYAARNGAIRVRQLKTVLHLRVSYVTLTSLNHAGFIEFSASKPLATRARAKETETETESPKSPYKPRRRSRTKEDDADRELLQRALDLAADWEGGPSDEFDAGLDRLEQELHRRLPYSQRAAIWDVALKRDPGKRQG